MAIVRLEVMKALQAVIAAAAPGLEMVVGPPNAERKVCFPSLAIHPTRFRFDGGQESHYFSPDSSHEVVHVGTHEATLQLRLLTATPGERYALEEKLINMFFATEGHPGVLLTLVPALNAQFGSFQVAWELEDDEWADEKAYADILGSVITVTAIVPALATRAGVYNQDELFLAFSEEMLRPFTTGTLLPPLVEVIEINEDGSIS